MGTTIENILARNNFEQEIDGVTFSLRRITAEMSIKIIGMKSLGMVRGAAAGTPLSPAESLNLVSDMMPKYLEAAMVDPKLGPVTVVEDGVISLEDLGDFALKVFNAVFEKSGYGKLVNFPISSEAMTEESFPKS